MKYLEAYDELLVLIDVYRDLYYSYKTAFYSLMKMSNDLKYIGSIDYSGMPKSSMVNPDIQFTFSKLLKTKTNMILAKETLDQLEKDKNRIEAYISSLEGTKHKIAYLAIIKNKDNEFIAKTLGIAEKTVKNIKTKIKNEAS